MRVFIRLVQAEVERWKSKRELHDQHRRVRAGAYPAFRMMDHYYKYLSANRMVMALERQAAESKRALWVFKVLGGG